MVAIPVQREAMKLCGTKPSRRLLVVLFLVGCATAIWLAVSPRQLAKVRCADGSVLVIHSVTFGTNHMWSKVSGSDPGGQFNSKRPRMALWGTWKGKSANLHSFRFELLYDIASKPWSALTNVAQFGPGEQSGLLAATTNAPGMLLYIRVYEDTIGEHGPPVEFMVKNRRIIEAQSKRPSKWSVSLNPPRDWSLKTDLIIANGRTSTEILKEKVFIFGPVAFSQKFD